MGSTVHMAFRFPIETADDIREYAKSHDLSNTEVVIEAVTRYLSNCDTDNRNCDTDVTHADDVPWRELYYFERDKRAENEKALREELTEIRKSLQAAQFMEGRRLAAAVEGEQTAAVEVDNREPTKPMSRWQHFLCAIRGDKKQSGA